MVWPRTAEALIAAQKELGQAVPEPWDPRVAPSKVGGCFVCFPRGPRGPGKSGDTAWAAAIVVRRQMIVAKSVVVGTAGAPYEAGLLALREGALLEAAIRATDATPEVLLVDATGRDHPRGAGLALHLGAVLEIPAVGVTHRPLVAEGAWPPDAVGATAPLVLEGRLVGYWLRTRVGTRPVAVHAGWGTDPETAVAVVLASLAGHRTPEPLRLARMLARDARATCPAPPA